MEQSTTQQPTRTGIDIRGLIAIIVMLLAWSSAYAGIRVGLTAFTPGHMALLRFLVASAAMLVLGIIARIRFPAWRDLPAIALLGLAGFTIYHVFLAYGETTVSAGAAGLINSAEPMFCALLAVAFLKERIRPWGWFGIIVSFVGVALITVGEGQEFGQGFELNVGAVFVLIASFSIAIYGVFQKPLLKKYTSLEFATYAMLAGTFFMLIFTPGFVDEVQASPPSAILTVVFLALVPGVLGNIAWTYALSRGEVSRVNSSIYLLPVLSIIVAWAWIGEIPSLFSLMGGGITLVGVALVAIKGK
jgi:drug/metabolite transporter (DMT)-like permease